MTRTRIAGFAALAAVILLGMHLMKPQAAPDYREYRPGMIVSSDEHIVTVTVTMDTRSPRTNDQVVRVKVVIGGKTDVNKVIGTSPWARPYLVKKGVGVLAEVTQGHHPGEFGCVLHVAGVVWDEDFRQGQTAATCEYRG